MRHHWVDQSPDEAQCMCGVRRHISHFGAHETMSYTDLEGVRHELAPECFRPEPSKPGSDELDTWIGKKMQLRVGVRSDGGVLVPRNAEVRPLERRRHFFNVTSLDGRRLSKIPFTYLQFAEGV